MSEERVFSPENDAPSTNIQQLTPQSPEAEIRDAFIKWSKEVLMPMLDDIIRALEVAYEPYREMRIFYDEDVAERKSYISGAIKALKSQRVVYCDMIDGLSAATALNQFLTIMGSIEMRVTDGTWTDVSFGMGDANMYDRYEQELWPAIMFRYDEARRIIQGDLDNSHESIISAQWQKHTTKITVESLNTLGQDLETNAEILYRYFQKVLHPLVCKIFKMDIKHQADWGHIFDDISAHGASPPEFNSLLGALLRWEGKVEAYLKKLPKEATRNPGYGPARQELFRHIAILKPHLLRLQTAREVKEV